MKREEKYLDYSVRILAHTMSIFDEESDNYIDLNELNEDDNMTHFMHALSNVVPSHVFNKFTEDDKNHLEFNHIANSLCFQYMNKPK